MSTGKAFETSLGYSPFSYPLPHHSPYHPNGTLAMVSTLVATVHIVAVSPLSSLNSLLFALGAALLLVALLLFFNFDCSLSLVLIVSASSLLIPLLIFNGPAAPVSVSVNWHSNSMAHRSSQ